MCERKAWMKKMEEKTVKKVRCNICSAGCPIDAYVQNGKLVSVEGSRDWPDQTGGLCAKGAASRQYVYNQDRILYPMKRTGVRESGKFERISWEEAYEMIAENLLSVRERYGAQSTVFYAGYPKWYRPALLRLANAYGTPNYCTESSTCFQSAVLAWKSIYGNHLCFPDLKHAKTLLIWSNDLYYSNMSMAPVYQTLQKRGVNIIAVDPRETVTTQEADLHLKLLPGTDGALALSMAQVIIEEGLYDREFVEHYVYGFEEYRKYVQEFQPEKAAEITGVKADLIRQAARMYAQNSPAAVMFSASPVVHHVNGMQNYRAVMCLIALTGNYDVPGGNCPAPGETSPCNEYGKVKRFHDMEAIGEREFLVWFDLPCEEAQCSRLADNILKEQPYPIKAVVSFGLNCRMWPQPRYLQKALSTLDFYVNTDLFWSDSCKMADLVLPAASAFERDVVINGKGGMFYLSEQAIKPLGEAKNDIEIMIGMLQAMQLEDEALDQGYEHYMDHVLQPSGLSIHELQEHPEGMKGKVLVPPRFKSYEKTGFATPSGKVEFVSQVLEKYHDSHGYSGLPEYRDFRTVTDVDSREYPLILNTGSRKPQYFHSRTYRMSWLSRLEPAPLVELHPEDGKKLQIQEGDQVRVTTPVGSIEAIAALRGNGCPGVAHIYHGSPMGDANDLIPKDYLDPISGFPGYKSYFCKVEKVVYER